MRHVLFSLLVVLMSGHSGFSAERQRPNIILIMADDQGWGDVGYNGHPVVKTPELDAMAHDGFVFDRFYAAAPVCSPTRASVMTGRHPIRTKVSNHGHYLRPQEITLAETLKAAGYVTGIFGKLHIGSAQPGSPCNPSAMGFDEWVVGLNFFDNDPYLSRNGTIEHRKGKGSVLLVDDTIEFLKKHKSSKRPIFTVVWFPSPHVPHSEVPDGPSLYDGEQNAGYFREITLLDQQLGRLRRTLKELDLAENTILWYCSDNGGLLKGSSGGRNKKGSIYEGGLRVPAMVEWPAKGLKGRTTIPVNTCDLYPTLLAMAGMKPTNPYPLDGVDVSGVFDGSLKQRRPMGFWHNFQPGQVTHSDRILKEIIEKQQAGAPLPHNPARMQKDVADFPQYPEDTARGHAAWTDWPWKLHRIKGNTYELYNLEDDPMEQNNLSAQPGRRVRLERMQRELDAWMRSVVRSVNGLDYEIGGIAPDPMNRAVPSVVLDSSDIPEREPWGKEGVRLINVWYPRIAKLLDSAEYQTPENIHLKINNPGKGVAATAGNRIFVAASWIEREPGHGYLIHELVHVVQAYRGGGVGWCTEGIADYIRWGLYEEKPLEWFPVPRNPEKDYRQSYQVAAGFLLWLETERSPGMVKKLNAAAREKRYSDDLFEKETGTTLDGLWAEYKTVREKKG